MLDVKHVRKTAQQRHEEVMEAQALQTEKEKEEAIIAKINDDTDMRQTLSSGPLAITNAVGGAEPLALGDISSRGLNPDSRRGDKPMTLAISGTNTNRSGGETKRADVGDSSSLVVISDNVKKLTPLQRAMAGVAKNVKEKKKDKEVIDRHGVSLAMLSSSKQEAGPGLDLGADEEDKRKTLPEV